MHSSGVLGDEARKRRKALLKVEGGLQAAHVFDSDQLFGVNPAGDDGLSRSITATDADSRSTSRRRAHKAEILLCV